MPYDFCIVDRWQRSQLLNTTWQLLVRRTDIDARANRVVTIFKKALFIRLEHNSKYLQQIPCDCSTFAFFDDEDDAIYVSLLSGAALSSPHERTEFA